MGPYSVKVVVISPTRLPALQELIITASRTGERLRGRIGLELTGAASPLRLPLQQLLPADPGGDYCLQEW
jgi:hypothetical protein